MSQNAFDATTADMAPGDSTAASSIRPRRRSCVAQSATTRPGTQALLPSRMDGGPGNGAGSDAAWDDDAWEGGEQSQGATDNNNRVFFSDAEDDAGLESAERRQRQRTRHLLRLDERVIEGGVGDSIAREFAFEGGGRGSDSRAGLLDHGYGGDSDHDDDHDDADELMGRPEAVVTEDERREADKNVLRRLLASGALIGLWYLFSLSLSLYNKWMFGQTFPFPLFTTSMHMLVQFLLAFLVLYFVPSLRPGAAARSTAAPSATTDADGGVGRDSEDADKPEPADAASASGKGSATMTPWFYLTRIGPCGAATGLDIGLGNASLKLITLTFYTMCKSSSLAFVLLFAFAFRLETPTLRLVAIIATMTVGVVMMVAGEVEFDPLGFFLVISAAFFSGFRWGLTQILLLRNPATSNPFSSIFYLAPVMFVTLFALAVPMEGFGALVAGVRALAAQYGPVRTPLLLVFPGTIAFLMTASEFALLQRTSVVTLSIAGIFKEVVTIGTAMLVYHDSLTLVNVLGLVVTISAIAVYNYVKITRMRRQAQLAVRRGHHHALHPLSASSAPASPQRAAAVLFSAPTSPPLHPRPHEDDEAEAEASSENVGLLSRLPGPSSHGENNNNNTPLRQET